MQTFLPYADFFKSAICLDRQRLGKQRVECLQLLKALNGETRGWQNHPACVMWRGHEMSLLEYGLEVCAAWVSRGYKDTCAEKMLALVSNHWGEDPPSWLGDEKFHQSHQSNLVRKYPDYYGPMFDVPDNLEYFWPNP